MTRLEPFTEAVLPYMPFLIPLPVILPALAAAGCLLFPRMLNVRRAFVFFTLLALAVLSATMLIVVDGEGIQTLQIGGWDAPLGITLVADRLSTMMLFVSSIILFAVMWFAIAQGIRDDTKDEPVAVFLPSYMLLTMGVNLSFLAGDLFNLYVGFEIFLVASYVLMTLGASPSRVRAGVGYVMVSMASSMVFLFGIAVTYAAVGTVNLAQIGQRMEDIPGGTQAAIFGVLLVAFGIKAAVFPLDSWLPDAYPTAPSLVTAVFAGLLTKVGVYAIIRMRTTVFTDGSLDALLMLVALATMLIGILGAMAQNDIKRLLSFTLVSHIGFMIFGIGLGSSQGLSGAIFYMVHHILVQTALFLVVGLIERPPGTSSLRTDYRRAVPHPGAQPGRHPAVFRLHGQSHALPRWRRGQYLDVVGADRRRRGDLPADALRDGHGLVQGLPPRPERRPGRQHGHRPARPFGGYHPGSGVLRARIRRTHPIWHDRSHRDAGARIQRDQRRGWPHRQHHRPCSQFHPGRQHLPHRGIRHRSERADAQPGTREARRRRGSSGKV